MSAWEASLGGSEVTREDRTAFIRHWVEQELLFQAAIDRGLQKDPWVVSRMDDLNRSLVITRLLDLEAQTVVQPSTSRISEYFQEHSTEFLWPHTHIVIDYWRSEETRAMNQLRSNLVRGRQVGIWPGDSGSLETGRIALDGSGSAAPEVWKTVNRMKVGQVSDVMKIQNANWVFKVIERRAAGDPQDIDDVHDEIVSRLIEAVKREQREDLVRSLVDEFRRDGRLQWTNLTPITTVNDTITHRVSE